MAREMRIHTHEQFKGSVYVYQVDLTVLDQELGTTSSTVTWSTDDTSIVSIGTSAFSSKIASCPITASNKGTALIKLSISTGSDDAPVYFFKVNVLDPEQESSKSYYR